MAQVNIRINGVSGPNLDFALQAPPQPVTFSNLGDGTEATFQWEVVDAPEGGVVSPGSTNLSTFTFTPTVRGTYLVRLTVNPNTPGAVSGTTLLAIRHQHLRIPAVREQQEAGANGWGTAVQEALAYLDDLEVTPEYGEAGDLEPVSAEAAAAGSLNLVARADHKHDVEVAAPADLGSLGANSAVGSSTALARADHQHSTIPQDPDTELGSDFSAWRTYATDMVVQQRLLTRGISLIGEDTDMSVVDPGTHLILCGGGPLTLTLPPAGTLLEGTNLGRVLKIKNIGAETVTIQAALGDTIDSIGDPGELEAGGSVELISDGGSWRSFGGGGGGGGTTYSADGTTLQLSGTTFSVKSGGVGTTQLANQAVDSSKVASSVAGAGLTGGNGAALAVQVDGSTVEVHAGSLRVRNGGVSSTQLATGAVTEAKIGSAAVTAPALGAGAIGQVQVGYCSQLDVAGQPSSGEVLQLSVEVEGYTSGPLTFTAGTEFAIGATAADTLNNLAAAIETATAGKCAVHVNSAGDYALLRPVPTGYPQGSTQDTKAMISFCNLTNYVATATAADFGSPPPTMRRFRSVWSGVRLVVSASDVARGFIAAVGDCVGVFQDAITAPWLLCKTSAGVMKACGAEVQYDATLEAWTITNTGTNNFAAGDEILLLTFTPQLA